MNGLDFSIYFPTVINNKKIRRKLSETISAYKALEPTANTTFPYNFFSKGLEKIGSEAYKLIHNSDISSDIKTNLKEFVGNTVERVTSVIVKKPGTSRKR